MSEPTLNFVDCPDAQGSHRMAYWQILMLSGSTIGLGITELVERWGRLRRLPWLEVPLIGILIALPLTLIVMGAGAMFFGTDATGEIRIFGTTPVWTGWETGTDFGQCGDCAGRRGGQRTPKTTTTTETKTTGCATTNAGVLGEQ